MCYDKPAKQETNKKYFEHEKEILKLGSWSTTDKDGYYSQKSDIEKRIENEKSKEKQIMIERKRLEDKKVELKQEINKLEMWVKENSFKETL